MANEQAHRLKADQNRDFLRTIGDGYADWLAVVAFYRAVHLVEAVFARDSIHSTDHNGRNNLLKRSYKPLWAEFKPLFDSSRLARYSEKCISSREARENLLGKHLPALEAHVEALLAAPTKPKPVTHPSHKKHR